jgi:hypothetical protein
MPSSVSSLFDIKAIGTYAGASLAVVILTNTFRTLTGINAAWPAFVFSLVVSGIGAYAANSLDNGVVGIFIVVLNACLLFCSALGMQETALQAKPQAGGARPQGRGKVGFLSAWFR